MVNTLEVQAFEIFGLIFEHLSVADINGFSKTSQHFRAVALPFLYHTISFDWTFWRQAEHQFLFFLKSILRNPDLARHVKQFSLQIALHCVPFSLWRPTSYTPSTTFFDSEHQECTRNAVERFGHGSKLGSVRCNRWLEQCLSGKRDAMIGLLICHLSELKGLSLCHDIFINSIYVAAALSDSLLPSCGTLLPRFASLRKFEFCSEGYHPGVCGGYNQLDHDTLSWGMDPFESGYIRYNQDPAGRIDTALTFLHAPNIDTLTLFLAEPPVMYRWPDTISTSLRSLTLHHSEAEPRTLAAVLFRTPKLESLRYDYHINTGLEINGYLQHFGAQCSGSKIGEAVQQVSKTLEHLSISVCFFHRQYYCMGIEGGHCRFPTSIGSLLHMTKLESLEINAGLLFGWNNEHHPDLSLVLPRSLQDLTLSLSNHIGYQDKAYPWTEDDLLLVLRRFKAAEASCIM